MEYKPTIGLEIHAELKTSSKMFCDCKNDPNQIEPNKNVCPICMGHPGTLPTPNKKAIEMVIKTGLAMNAQIAHNSKFDRKNYFYPDLPKAYQISQYDQPLCSGGFLVLPENKKKINLTRIHLEEDTAKLSHAADGKSSLVDFNRAGVPLMELVTEPDFHDPKELTEFAQEFQLLLRYLGVSNADMEKGNLRLEANISISDDENTLGTKVEVKNLNSFKSLERGAAFEIKRQQKVLEKGEKVVQETRGWDETKEETFSQRSKESAHDYRYFPEPDIPPLVFDETYIQAMGATITETPQQRRERFSQEYNLSHEHASFLVQDMFLGDFFEEAVSELRAENKDTSIDLVYNYITSDAKGLEADRKVPLALSKLTPAHIADIILLIEKGSISSRVAKDILAQSFDTGIGPEDALAEQNLGQISDESELGAVIDKVIDENNSVWYNYKEGKENALQFLIGQVMKETKGRANPTTIIELFKKSNK